MRYEIRTKDEWSVIVDEDGKSIVDIASQFDGERGCNVLTPVLDPATAERIAYLLNNHDHRVTELLASNNALLERARKAEAELAKYAAPCPICGKTTPHHPDHSLP